MYLIYYFLRLISSKYEFFASNQEVILRRQQKGKRIRQSFVRGWINDVCAILTNFDSSVSLFQDPVI